jgi:hypothetical protein
MLASLVTPSLSPEAGAMNYLQGLRLFFGMMLFFGVIFQMQGGEKGPMVRTYEFAVIVIGAVGSLVMWGIGLGKPTPGTGGGLKCQVCGESPPAVRKPANRRQMLWGGWTCRGCGYELDRAGRKVSDPEPD